MQAVFLDSAQKSRGGTGVFLPQRAGTDFHSKKKPGMCPDHLAMLQVLI